MAREQCKWLQGTGSKTYDAALAVHTGQRPLKFLERIVTGTVRCAFFLRYR